MLNANMERLVEITYIDITSKDNVSSNEIDEQEATFLKKWGVCLGPNDQDCYRLVTEFDLRGENHELYLIPFGCIQDVKPLGYANGEATKKTKGECHKIGF